MKTLLCSLFAFALLGGPLLADAQACDPATAPGGLSASYTPGSGALLQWTAVPSSIGVQIKATTPSGANATRRLVGAELDQYLVPDALLDPGVYTWQVQAACSTVPPYGVTPISPASTFTVAVAGTCPATVTDVDGNLYNTVQIGAQCWMAENLATEHYRDGSAMLSSLDPTSWSITSTGAFAIYNNDSTIKATDGFLYNGYAAIDARGICPTGWHIPSDAEWTEMATVLDPGTCSSCTGAAHSPFSGIALKSSSTDTPAWNGTNASGFGGIAGGYRDGSGAYNYRGDRGYWWTSSSAFGTAYWFRLLQTSFDYLHRGSGGRGVGFSVRCIQD